MVTDKQYLKTGTAPLTSRQANGIHANGIHESLGHLAHLEQDLQLARELQQAMLPFQYPTFPRNATPPESALLFHHTYRSNEAIGGDFCAIFPLSDTVCGVFVCDVMGHGVRAALVTAMISALLEESKPLAFDPGALLTEVNRGLGEILQRARTPVFASAFYMVADVAEGELRFANAGHPAPLHARRPASGHTPCATPLDGVAALGPVLGMTPDTEYSSSECRLAVGDVLLLFTDGLFETAREDGELFGEARVLEGVQERLARVPDMALPTLCNGLIEDAARFADGFDDDLCLVGVEVTRLGVLAAAGRDRLTGLFNQNYLREALERELHRAERHGYQVGVITLEISGLEQYAENHGQRAVDDLLREFGAVLSHHTRSYDIACRPHPDGFTVILPESSPGNTQRRATQICEALRQHHAAIFEKGELSLALGLASFPQHGTTAEAIVRAATEAMQTAQMG